MGCSIADRMYFYMLVILYFHGFCNADTTLYLSPSGNDSSVCSASAPCYSLSHVSLIATQNSTITLSQGTYTVTSEATFNVSVNIVGGPGVTLVCSSQELMAITFSKAPLSNISGLTMSNCSTALGFINSPSATVANTVLTAGQSGIYVAFSDDVTITNSTVSGMRSTGNAAIAVVSSNNFLLKRSQIQNNSNSAESGIYGGGLRLFHSSKAIVRRCTFTQNTAPRGAAIITDLYSSTRLKNCVFDSNTATLYGGGAVYANISTTLSIRFGTFLRNSAAQNGGAIFVEDSALVDSQDSQFLGNAAVNGGALALGANSNVSLSNCTFDTNSASQTGGAIFMGPTSLATVSASVLQNNSASNGGAIYIIGGTITVTQSQLTRNNANNYGAIGSFNATTSISISAIQNNTVTSNGGGIGVLGTSNATIQNSSVIFNYAAIGGGIYFSAMSAIISNSNFTNNAGGAIEITPDAEMNLRVVATQLTNSGAPYKFCCVNKEGLQNVVAADVESVICDYPACNSSQCATSPSDTCLCANPKESCKCGSDWISPFCTTFDSCKLPDFCGANSSCSESAYTFTCSCLSGFAQTGAKTCMDINECETNATACNSTSVCVNTIGSYECVSCPAGFQMNGTNCSDINECIFGAKLCNTTSTCVNTPGSFNCVPCPVGSMANGTDCVDINECTGANLCNATALCVNTIGSYMCVACPSGFLSNGSSCIDFDECANATICGPTQYCVNTQGSYVCSSCPQGFQVTGASCTDINECLTKNGGCDYHTQCENTVGSFSCGPCPTGFSGNGSTGCKALCGNGVCESSIGENCVSCPFDCSLGNCEECGDRVCNGNETCKNCVEDCGICASNSLIYSKKAVVAIQCQDPTCSKHGTCKNGTCECFGTWNGPSCESENIPIKVIIPLDTPTMTISPHSSLNFSLSISEIREMDRNGNIIDLAVLANVNFSTADIGSAGDIPTNSQWILNGSLDNFANVVVNIWAFNNATNLTFANSSTSYLPQTTKFSFQIVNWPFKNLQNSLQIVMDYNTTKSSNHSECGKDTEASEDLNGNLKWFTLVLDHNTTLYGQFSDLAVIDNLVRKVNFTLSNGVVSAIIPHFWSSAEIDPSFSVLLTGSSNGCAHSPSRRTKLIIEIVVPVVSAILVGVLMWTLVRPQLALQIRLRKGRVNVSRHSETLYPTGGNSVKI